MSTRSHLARWRWAALPAIGIVLLSLIPQLHFWLIRGSEWQGAYATLQGDEFLYSAYVNALIDGRPRLNDPFTGRDDTAQLPLPESTFSIQLIPAFAISWFAQALGTSASNSFVALLCITGLLAAVAVFWLLLSVTADSYVAAVGTLLVLCCGALAGGQGILGIILKSDAQFLGMPFLRRYQPAASFPLFFIFCTMSWGAFTLTTKRSARLRALLAGLTLAVLVFSYLYLWTAAVAWLICLVSLGLYLRPAGKRRDSLEMFAITSAIAICAVVPFAYLVSHRAESLDEAQTLISTHQPDLFRAPEIIGAFIILALIIGIRRGEVVQSDPRLIFAASLALLPFVIFNQQVVTGKSMQAYHYEVFVANYGVLVGLVIATRLLWQPIAHRSLLWIALLCLLWGAVEVGLPQKGRIQSATSTDQIVPVLLRLKELARQDGTLTGLRAEGRTPTLVFSPHIEVMRWLPTWAPQGTLLGMGALDFGSVSREERKHLLYSHLYYSARDATYLRELLNNRIDDLFMNYFARSVIFGKERVLPFLGSDFKPISQDEIEKEVQAYQSFVEAFGRGEVLRRPLAYVITFAKTDFDFSRIDLWYHRDSGETVGGYTLFSLKLRQDQPPTGSGLDAAP